MFNKCIVVSLVVISLMVSVLASAPWNPRESQNDPYANPRSPSTRNRSAAYYGLKPQRDSFNYPSHTRPPKSTVPVGNRSNPSTRGKGGVSTARINTEKSSGDLIKEQQRMRYTYLIDQRRAITPKPRTISQHPKKYLFRLDPNPQFKPFLLKSGWNKSDEDNNFRLWDPYSDGLFQKNVHSR